MSFPLCETVSEYEFIIDSDNNCLRDLNTSELNKKYKTMSFTCCGTVFDHRKRKTYFHTHTTTGKHKKFLSLENDKYREDYGDYIDKNELINFMRKEIRDYKTQLHYKSEESKLKSTQIDKLEIINTDLKKMNIDYKEKLSKKTKKNLRIDNLIDL